MERRRDAGDTRRRRGVTGVYETHVDGYVGGHASYAEMVRRIHILTGSKVRRIHFVKLRLKGVKTERTRGGGRERRG